MAERVKIRLMPDNLYVEVEKGATISQAAQKAGVYLTHPCGGNGSCGRCLVFADGKAVKACVTPAEDGMKVLIPNTVRLTGQTILTDIRMYLPENNGLPRVERLDIRLETPTLADSTSDERRLREAIAAALAINEGSVWLEPRCLRDLPQMLRDRGFAIKPVVIHENGGVTVLSLKEGPLYGVAVDVGTTTVAAALCDLETGFVLDSYAAPNPQAEYGSDVINRIVYTEENVEGLDTLQKAILSTLGDAVRTLAGQAEIPANSIPVMAIAANNVMAHFIMGMRCEWLRREPYVPAANEYPPVRAAELSIPIMPQGRVLLLPGVASYVGGDITAGVIATDLASKPGLNMLVDVGTNGEMVLAGDGFMMACSCSAGPAFEGSGISCGSRAVRGAVDNVYYHHGHMVYDIIGGHSVEPTSVCGSGLISLLAALLQKGEIDRSGRFNCENGSYMLAPKVVINQADIMNLIRAKAAIFAGMRVLAKSLDLNLMDIDHLYVAGGFGRNLNVGYATNIGMFPPLPKESFSYVGNTALAGALRLLNDRELDASAVARGITNIALSIGNDFMEEFTMACFLPHTEMSFYQNI